MHTTTSPMSVAPRSTSHDRKWKFLSFTSSPTKLLDVVHRADRRRDPPEHHAGDQHHDQRAQVEAQRDLQHRPDVDRADRLAVAPFVHLPGRGGALAPALLRAPRPFGAGGNRLEHRLRTRHAQDSSPTLGVSPCSPSSTGRPPQRYRLRRAAPRAHRWRPGPARRSRRHPSGRCCRPTRTRGSRRRGRR